MRQGESFCSLDTYSVETVVVGSGAAGYNTSDSLLKLGYKNVVLLSENLQFGTSRNTGSDKQTYYKLSLCGGDSDSVRSMAEDFFSGGAVDGDLALAEAAGSAPSFLKLASLGVPFPVTRYGEYVGYKTDHDPRKRATSAGPYTSRFMTEALEASLKEQGATLLDGYQVVRILHEEDEVRGVLCLRSEDQQFCILWCRNLVWATGGPAVMYANSVYPVTQFGASGLAFEAGCMGRNLTEWQYGMASLKPRWNVSGTYMQVLPCFYSIDEEGQRHDFLLSQFEDPYEMLSWVFLKGYQWPFDVRKIESGSSIIDLLVYQELEKGRRVYLDYRQNPLEEELNFDLLQEEAALYLQQSGATFGLPIDRLKVMNAPAYEFYLDHGVDLAKEPLEISLCAQHNNGGLAVDVWWQTNVKGMFAVGEAAGTHGVYRPGGSALNAGQVGSVRAATYIQKKCHDPQWKAKPSCASQVQEILALAEEGVGPTDTASPLYRKVRSQMSLYASLIREEGAIRTLYEEVLTSLEQFSTFKVSSKAQLGFLFRLRDCLLSQSVYLYAMGEYLQADGLSRGSSLYLQEDGKHLHPLLPAKFSSRLAEDDSLEKIMEVVFKNGKREAMWRKRRPLPEEDAFFETVWKTYREHGNVE